MMLTDLADVLRRAGLPVVEHEGWRTRGHGPVTSVACIVLHHTAGPTTGEAPSLGVVRDGRPGLPGPLAQLVLGRSGTWYVVAAGLSYHAGVVFEPWMGNAYAIGVEAEHTGRPGDPWPPAQYASYVRGVRALADRYGVPYDRVLGHKEVAKPLGRKVDPTFDCAAFRAALTTTGASVSLEGDVALLVSQLVKGPDEAQWGWPTWEGGTGERLTVVDYLRRSNVEVRQLRDAVGDLAARIDGLTVVPTVPASVDLDALAAKVADLLSARLAS